MANEEDAAKEIQVVEARARNISHNVRCTECGSQSIEDSQADIAILLRKVFYMDSIKPRLKTNELLKYLVLSLGLVGNSHMTM